MKRLSPARRQKLIALDRRRSRRARRRGERHIEGQITLQERVLRNRRTLAAANLPYGGDPRREHIVLPACLSLSKNYEETAQAFEQIRRVGLVKSMPLMIRLEKVQELDAAAALVLAAEIYRCRKLRPHLVDGRGFVSGTYPDSELVQAQLEDMGFFNMLDVGIPPDRAGQREHDPERPQYLHFRTDHNVDGTLVDAFVSVVEDLWIPMSPLARSRLVVAIKEAMGNVTEHAYDGVGETPVMSGRWYLCCRIDPTTNEVMVMLYDQGVGIPRTINPTIWENMRSVFSLDFAYDELRTSDGFRIRVAATLFRSGTGNANRGRGFRDMRQFVDSCKDGELRVLSNRGLYSYTQGRERTEDHSCSLGGTVVEWRFSSDGILDIVDE